jgi:hypothetical protein
MQYGDIRGQPVRVVSLPRLAQHRGTPLSSSFSRRPDPDLRPQSAGAGTIVTLLSLLLLGVVVTAVALFVLRTSPTAFLSAPDAEPTGTVIAAAEISAAPPTLIPTVAPNRSSTRSTDQTQAIAVLPTVAAPVKQPIQAAPPTPTPRAVVLPTVIPMTLPSPEATRPPSLPVSYQPIAAFAGTDAPPEPLAATAPQPTAVTIQPARSIQPSGSMGVAPTRVSSPQDNVQRARELQTNRGSRGSDRSQRSASNAQAAMPAPVQSVAQPVNVPVVPINAAPNPSVSVPDANSIRADVAARINAPRP